MALWPSLVRPLPSEMWDKVLLYSGQAGAKAVTHSAYHEAAACFEQALGALKRLPEIRVTMEQAIDLHCDLRNVLTPLGEYQQTFDFLREADRLITSS
jgi:hypothetical protein